MHRKNPGQFLTDLMEQTENGSFTKFSNQIPAEIGFCHVQEKKTQQGVIYTDWEMHYQEDVYVRKRGQKNTDDLQLIFFLNRGMEWKMVEADQVISMEKGELCIYRDQSYATAACYKGGCEFLFKSVQMPMRFVERMLEECFESKEKRMVEEMFQSVVKTGITPYMYRLLQEVADGKAYRGGIGALYMESKTLEVLAACLKAGMEVGDEAVSRRTALSRSDQESILNIKRRIDQNSADIPGCSVLSREANLSMTKLTRGFKELTGVPLHAYVIDRRLEYAAYLLTQNGINVSQAAVHAGYSNMSHFSAAFKKKFGVLPKDYCG